MWHCAAAGASPPAPLPFSGLQDASGWWGIKAAPSWFGEPQITPFIGDRLLQGSPPCSAPVVAPLKAPEIKGNVFASSTSRESSNQSFVSATILGRLLCSALLGGFVPALPPFMPGSPGSMLGPGRAGARFLPGSPLPAPRGVASPWEQATLGKGEVCTGQICAQTLHGPSSLLRANLQLIVCQNNILVTAASGL